MSDVSPISVYVHVPFCEQKCAYCDFFTITDPINGTQKSDSWLQTCVQEARLWMNDGGWNTARPIRSVFLGGGTPSLASPGAVAKFLEELAKTCPFQDDIEITLETQPGTAGPDKLRDFAAAGVTRFSIGAQTFRESILQSTGRRHTANDTKAAIAAALETGRIVGIDLISGLPGHTIESWRQDLDEALAFQTQHISVYELTWHQGTEFYRALKTGKLAEPGDEFRIQLLELTLAKLTAAGFEHYEISNYARPGARSIHNQNYWKLGDYVGLGAGAHSFLFPHRYFNPNHPAGYLQSISAGKLTRQLSDPADPEILLLENLQMAIRLLEGVDLQQFGHRFGKDVLTQWSKSLTQLVNAGLIHWDPPQLTLTREGQLKSDGIVEFLLT